MARGTGCPRPGAHDDHAGAAPGDGAAVARAAALAAEYHLGWTDVDGRPVADGGAGKHVRAALALLSAAAVGADEAVGVPGAVAVELVHNFSLMHDDVIDVDRERRHRPTVWAAFGVGHAITAGDALATLAIQVLLDEGTPPAVRGAVRAGRRHRPADRRRDGRHRLRDRATTSRGTSASRCRTPRPARCSAAPRRSAPSSPAPTTRARRPG